MRIRATAVAVTMRASWLRWTKSESAYASPAQAISSGRAVCECLNNGESGLELVHDVKTHNPGMDMEKHRISP